MAFHEERCLLLGLIREHFSALKNSTNRTKTNVNVAEDFLYSYNLHEYEGFYWIFRVEMLLRDANPVKCLRLVELLPSLTNRAKDNCPLLDVES